MFRVRLFFKASVKPQGYGQTGICKNVKKSLKIFDILLTFQLLSKNSQKILFGNFSYPKF